MKRIILDHLRRWWLTWTAIGIGNLLMAGLITDSGQPFSLFYWQVIFRIGAFQLQYDLPRGVARTLASVPVTLTQIGRAWWLVSVALPALFLAVTAALGLVGYALLLGKVVSLTAYVLFCVTNTALLGAVFYLIVGGIGRGWPQTPAQWLHMILFYALIAEMFVPKSVSLNTTNGIILTITTTGLTIAGWFRAGQFAMNRANPPPVVARGAVSRKGEAGFGGLPLLFARIFVRSWLFGFLLIAMMLVMFSGMNIGHANGDSANRFVRGLSGLTGPTQFQFFWMPIFQFAPLILHLRFIRTAPISTNALAAVLVLLPALVNLSLGAVIAALGYFGAGISPTPALINGALAAGAGALAISVLVGRGMDRNGMALAIFIMITTMTPMIFFENAKWMWIKLLVAAIELLVAWFMTRAALQKSTHAYRTQGNIYAMALSGGR